MTLNHPLVWGSIALTLSGLALFAGAEQHRTSAPTAGAAVVTQARDRLDVTQTDIQDLRFEQDNGRVSTVITIDDHSYDIELEPHSNRSDLFRVLVQYGAETPLVEFAVAPPRTYRGTIPGLPGSEIRATFKNGMLDGIIYTADEDYAIQPVMTLGIDAPANLHVVHKASDARNSRPFTCGVTHPPVDATPADAQRQTAGTGLRIIEIGLDADAEYFNIFGNVADTVDDMENIINLVEPKYSASPINAVYEITTIIVRTVVGVPYTSTTSGGLLNQMDSVWGSTPENLIQRDIAHLFTGRDLQGTVIGEASGIGNGCQTFNAYCVSQSLFSISINSRVGLTAHELGHNWGGFHCDGCGSCTNCCRIMCSGLGGCDGILTSFGCVAGNAIGNYMNGQSCLAPLPLPQTVPFCEDFPAIAIDSDRWIYVDGATGSVTASNPPSPSFALNLDASGSSDYADDEIRSNFIQTQGEVDMMLSYYTQHIGVEPGEELVVEFYSGLNEWQEINRITSNGVDQTTFVYHEHLLPTPAAYHSQFRLRFRAEVDGQSDDWYVDDISLDCFPPPKCAEPCTDGDACTVGDSCVTATTCAGTPVDCSGASDECSLATCDPIDVDGNCNIITPINDSGGCNGGDGYCTGGTCADATVSGRVFMAANGQQGAVVPGGPTTLVMSPGSTATVGVFIADNAPSGPVLMNGYQIVMPYDAQAQAGATGTVGYVDDNPGTPGGGSIFLDTLRSDWLYIDEVAILDPTYTENTDLGLFGVFYSTLPGQGLDVAALPGIQYLTEFELTASGDAEGEFILPFNLAPNAPPLSALFSPIGSEYSVDQYQPLRIIIGDGLCTTIADCADLDMNDIRDDNCLWWQCLAGQCLSTEVPFADMGGQFGACPPDGTADGNDRFAALNCFSNSDPNGVGNFPCEDDPPTAFNVDAGGQFGSCSPDGVCDGNDAFAALNAFGDTTTCSCPLDGSPAPAGPASRPLPKPFETTTVVLRPSKTTARPGDVIEIDVMLGDVVADLRGYQLHLATSGGTSGGFELLDITAPRGGLQDPISGRPLFSGVWTAFNVTTAQMVSGTDAAGVTVPRDTHLATFTYRVADDATGKFSVDLLHDHLDNTARTYLFPTPAHGRIVIAKVNTVTITVDDAARTTRRSSR